MKIDLLINLLDGSSRFKKALRLESKAALRFEETLQQILNESPAQQSEEDYDVNLDKRSRRQSFELARTIRDLNHNQMRDLGDQAIRLERPPSLSALFERPLGSFDDFMANLIKDPERLALAHGPIDRKRVLSLLD